MTPNRAIGLMVAAIVLFASQHIGMNSRLLADDPPPLPSQEQPEVLTRGPVHEAFAEPVTLQAQAGLIVTNQPPANIEEIPPADRPQGDRFVWVPGYWSWDSDRSDFIWVSACWRVGPPNTYWVPGYWARVTEVQAVSGGGVDVRVGGVGVHVGGAARPVETSRWEWVSGFWAPAAEAAQEIEYLPAPPAPIDLEPPGPPPAADNMWVPGCWYWQETQYIRRPGYWMQQQPNWVWEPSHYRWTPRGYVFEAGHWDYALDRRGVLFAPVYIPRSLYGRAGYSYSPTIAIDVGVLSANLFIYPRYSHYYFGDYYDDAYVTAGIYPQFESSRIHTFYDPIYTYDRWHYGKADKQWDERQRHDYDSRRADKNLRPARTYREMEARVAKMPEAQRRTFELAKPIQIIAASKASPLKFEQIKPDDRQKIAKQAVEVHKFRDERVKWESTGSTNPKEVRPPAEHKDPVKPPADHKDPVVTPPAGHAPVVVPPRDVNVTKPERVKIPVPPPVTGKPGAPGDVEKGPPPTPIDEHKHKADAPKADPKDTPKADPKVTPKADPKDAPKVDPKDAPKADPKPTPKPDPKDAPKPDPKDPPKANPKDKDKDKDKPKD